MWLWRVLFFVIDQKLVKTALHYREWVTAAASGQRERVRQLTALPRLARVSPMAPLIKFSKVSLTGTVEEMRNSRMEEQRNDNILVEAFHGSLDS